MIKHNVELLIAQSLQCGEVPVWEPHGQRLFWTDSGSDQLFCTTQENNEYLQFSAGIPVASLTLHGAGGLMLFGKDGFFHWSQEGKLRMVCNTWTGGNVAGINDIIADPLGRVFGGQEAFREGEDYKPGYFFRVDVNGMASMVDEGLHLANGMGFNPQADAFYLADTINGHIYRYDYDLNSGYISNHKTLLELNKEEGMPDGMTVDGEGFIWVARWFGNGIPRYDPDGKLERKIDLPVAQPSSITFGGADYNEIFITSAAIQWETPLAPGGHNFSAPRGGSVYRTGHTGQTEVLCKRII